MSDSAICRLDHFALIRVRGSEAREFLQGQLSNDIRRVTAGQGQLTSYNSPKGRVLAILQAFEHDGCIHLILPRDLLEPVLRRLRMFVLRADVTLEDASGDLPGLGLWGPAAEAALGKARLPVPGPAEYACRGTENGVLLRWPDASPRFALFAPESQLQQWQARLAETGHTEPASAWRRQDIRAGIPSVHPATQDRFVAQMLDLDRLGGLDFGKGCYTGQEVIARLHYLGKTKRRLYRARGNPAEPGTAVYAAGNAQAVGEVVNAMDGDILLVLQTDRDSEPLHLGAPDGPVLTLEAEPDSSAGMAD